MLNYCFFILIIACVALLYLFVTSENYYIEKFTNVIDGINIPNGGIYKKILNNVFYKNIILETNAKEELFIFLGKVNEKNNFIKNTLNSTEYSNNSLYPTPLKKDKNIGYEISLCEKNINKFPIEHYYEGFVYYIKINNKPISAFSKYNSMIIGSDNINNTVDILDYYKYRAYNIFKSNDDEFYTARPRNEKYGYSSVPIIDLDYGIKQIIYKLPFLSIYSNKDMSINAIPIVREIKENIDNPNKVLTNIPRNKINMSSIIDENDALKCLNVYGYIPKKHNNYPYILSSPSTKFCKLEKSNNVCVKLKFIATLKPDLYYIVDKDKNEEMHYDTKRRYKLGIKNILKLINEKFKIVYLRNGLTYNTKDNDNNQTYGEDENETLDAVYIETIKAYKFKDKYENEKVYYNDTSRYSLNSPECKEENKKILLKNCYDESCGSQHTKSFLTNCRDVENIDNYKNDEYHNIEEYISKTVEYIVNVPIFGHDLNHYDKDKLYNLSKNIKKDFNDWFNSLEGNTAYMFFDKRGMRKLDIINMDTEDLSDKTDINYNISPLSINKRYVPDESIDENGMYVWTNPIIQKATKDTNNTFIEIDLDENNNCIKVYTSKEYDSATKKLKNRLLILTYGVYEKFAMSMSMFLYPEISIAYKSNINDTYYNYVNKNKDLPLENVSGVKVKVLNVTRNINKIIPDFFEYLGGNECDVNASTVTSEIFGNHNKNICIEQCGDNCIGVSTIRANSINNIYNCTKYMYNNNDDTINKIKEDSESNINTHCYKKTSNLVIKNTDTEDNNENERLLRILKIRLFKTYGEYINNTLNEKIIDTSIIFPEKEFKGCYVENNKLKCDKTANDYIFNNMFNGRIINGIYSCYNNLNACNNIISSIKPVKSILRKNSINEVINEIKKYITPKLTSQQSYYCYYVDEDSKAYLVIYGSLHWWENITDIKDKNNIYDKIFDININNKEYKIILFEYYKLFSCNNSCTFDNIKNKENIINQITNIYNKYIDYLNSSIQPLKKSKCYKSQLVKTSYFKNNGNFVKIFANQKKEDATYKFFINGASTAYIFLGKIKNSSVGITKRNNVNVMPKNSSGVQITLDALMGANDKYGTYAIEVNGDTHKPISKFTKNNGDIVNTRILTGPESDEYIPSMPKPRSSNGSKPSLLGLDINENVYDKEGKMLDVRKYDVNNGIAGKYQTLYVHIHSDYLYVLYFSSVNPSVDNVTINNIIMAINVKDILNESFNVYICSDVGFEKSLTFLTSLKMIVPPVPRLKVKYNNINEVIINVYKKFSVSPYQNWYEIMDNTFLLDDDYTKTEKVLIVFKDNNDAFLKMLLNYNKCSEKRYEFPIYCYKHFEKGVYYNFLFYNIDEYKNLVKNITIPSKIINITEKEMEEQIKEKLKDKNLALYSFDHSLLNINGEIQYVIAYNLQNNPMTSRLNKTFHVFNKTKSIRDGNKLIKILYYDYNNIYNYWYVDKFTSQSENIDCFEDINTFEQKEQFNDDNINIVPENFTFIGRGSCKTNNDESPSNLVVPISINPRTFKPVKNIDDAYETCSKYCLPILEGGVAKNNDCIGFNAYKFSNSDKYNCNIYLNASADLLQKNQKYKDFSKKYNLYRRIKQENPECKEGICGPIKKVKKICEDFPQGCSEFYNNKIEEMGYACFSRNNAKIYKNIDEYNSNLIKYDDSIYEKQKKEMLEQMAHLTSLGLPVVYQQVKNINNEVLNDDSNYKMYLDLDYSSTLPISEPEQKKEEPINIDPLPECKGAFHDSYNECICPDYKPIMYERKYNDDGTKIKGDKKYHCIKEYPKICGISEDENMNPLDNLTFSKDPNCECPLNREKIIDNGYFWCDMRRSLDNIEWSECSPYSHNPNRGTRFKSTEIKFRNQGSGKRCGNTYNGRDVKLKTENCTPTNLDFDYWLKANIDVGCSTAWFNKDDNYEWNSYKNGVDYYNDNKDNDFSYQKLINNANAMKSQKSGACHMRWRGDYGKCVAEWETDEKVEEYYTCQTDINQCVVKRLNSKQVSMDPKYIDTAFKTKTECEAKCEDIHTAMNNNFTNVEYTNSTPLLWKHGSCANVATGGKRKIYWVCEPSGKGKGEFMVSPIFITEDRAKNDKSISPYIYNSKEDAIAACAPLPVEYEGPLIDEFDRISYLAINNYSFEKDDIEGNDVFNYNESIIPSYITTNDNSQQLIRWHESNKLTKHPELYGDKTAWFDEYIRFRTRNILLNTESDDCKSAPDINKYETPRRHLDVFKGRNNEEVAKDLSKLQFHLKWGYNSNNRSKNENIMTFNGFATNDGQVIGTPRRGKETVIETLYDCAQKCRDNLECKYFTYYPAVSSGFFKGRDKASIYPTNNYPETYHGSNLGGVYHEAASRYYDPFSPYNQKSYNSNPDLFGFYRRGKKHLNGNEAKKMKCTWMTGSNPGRPDESIDNDTNILPVHLMIDRNCGDHDKYAGCRGNILIKKETIPGLNEDLLIPYHYLDNRRDFLNDPDTSYPLKETKKYKELLQIQDKLPELIKNISNKVNETENKIKTLKNNRNKEKNYTKKREYDNEIKYLTKELDEYKSEEKIKLEKNNKISREIIYAEQEIIRLNKYLYNKIPTHDLSPFQKYSVDDNGNLYRDNYGSILFYLIPPMIDNVALYRYAESENYRLNKLMISCDNNTWKMADRSRASGNMTQGFCELFNFNTDSPPIHIENHRKTISGMLTDRKKYTGKKIKYKLYSDYEPDHKDYKQIGKRYLVSSEHG